MPRATVSAREALPESVTDAPLDPRPLPCGCHSMRRRASKGQEEPRACDRRRTAAVGEKHTDMAAGLNATRWSEKPDRAMENTAAEEVAMPAIVSRAKSGQKGDTHSRRDVGVHPFDEELQTDGRTGLRDGCV